MLCIAERKEALAEWRNRAMNPFKEPPFQLLWISTGSNNLLAFRAHHAVVDGEGFFAVCVEALTKLAERQSTDYTDEGLQAVDCRSRKRIGVREAFGNVQRLRKEARSNQSARLAMRTCTPGDTSIVERDLEWDDFRELQRQAAELSIAPGWLCASAWMKAIHAWNISRELKSTPSISIEVPVSLRRAGDRRIGNLISPLTLYGDAREPLDELAKALKQQMTSAVRRRSHLALPLLSSPAKLLPWPVFHKLAASPELTGFATSHFAWFEQAQAVHDDVLRLSGGALQMIDQQIYTPVCLHMGAALSVLAWPERAQIFLTYRLTAFSTGDAETLLDLMVQELARKHVSRRQVAV
jgi:hypothetical protein